MFFLTKLKSSSRMNSKCQFKNIFLIQMNNDSCSKLPFSQEEGVHGTPVLVSVCIPFGFEMFVPFSGVQCAPFAEGFGFVQVRVRV